MKRRKGNTRFGLLRTSGISELKDNDLMPDKGKYKGTAMVNIPARYLLWLFDNVLCTDGVRLYIKNNLSDLREETKK